MLDTHTLSIDRTRSAYMPIGFTIAEMILVLMLIGMLSGSVVVSLQGRDAEYAIRTTSQDLADAIRFAVEKAKVMRVPHRLVFDENQQAYWIEQADAENEAGYRPVTGRMGRLRKMAKGTSVKELSIDETSPVFVFHPNDFAMQLIVIGEVTERIQIEVLPETGKVEVTEIESSP